MSELRLTFGRIELWLLRPNRFCGLEDALSTAARTAAGPSRSREVSREGRILWLKKDGSAAMSGEVSCRSKPALCKGSLYC